ncbi:MAG: response regulator [Deltaproteobacteria bacterium]|jgi:signal transduction histidine kinase/DNA-binding response OmpR family regulator|nr:response regulator [Deltaproteobacteria bacterium]
MLSGRYKTIFALFIVFLAFMLALNVYVRSVMNDYIREDEDMETAVLTGLSVMLAGLAYDGDLDQPSPAAGDSPAAQARRRETLGRFAEEYHVDRAFLLRDAGGGKIQFLAQGSASTASDLPPAGAFLGTDEDGALASALGGAAAAGGSGSDGVSRAYAPVFDENGQVRAVAGVDLRPRGPGSRRLLNHVALLHVLSVLLVMLTGLVSLRLLEKEARKAKVANQDKSNFLARISHEIRTPMNAVMGISELLLRMSDAIPAQAQNYVRNIKQAAANLLSIVNDILDLSKIESGKFTINEAPYRLSLLVNDLVNIINVRLMEKPVRFIVSVKSHIPDRLVGDVTRLRQILLNLLSNAVKYTNEGVVTLSLDAAETRRGETTILAEVRDSGIGIKPEDVKTLFGDYVQLNDSSRPKVQGTGLGLAICKQLAQLMGGGISVSSSPGEGSVFKVEIPQKVETDSPMAEVDHPGGKSVLVYERRTVFAESIHEALEDLGVPHLLVDEWQAFREAMAGSGFSHIILPVSQYKIIKRELLRAAPGSSVAVTTEDLHPFLTDDVRRLYLPLYSRPLAEFLNNRDVPSETMSAWQAQVMFTAPEARALVVDDIQTNLMVIEGLLKPYDIKIQTSSGGKEAVELIRQNDYDIVFMDHMMSDQDGIEATRAVRELEGDRFKRVPIVAMTANALHGMAEYFTSSGMNDFLPKPIDPNRLNSILRRWLPPEKISEIPVPAPAAVSLAQTRYEFPRLRGVDSAMGLTRSGDNLEAYLKTMKYFLKDVRDTPGAIRSANHRRDAKEIAFQAHALKGSCWAIGANILAEQATAIESAVALGDMASVSVQVDGLLRNLSDAIDDLSAFVGQAENESLREGGDMASQEEIDGDLSVLRQAFCDTDAGGIDRVIKRLQNRRIPQWLRKSLEELWGHFQEVEYEEAIEQIEELLAGDAPRTAAADPARRH